MSRPILSSDFTTSVKSSPYGPPLIGALLRMSLETVRARMLDRLHERGFDDLAPAHMIVIQYPGPQGLRPSDLAARLRMSKQALNYLLGELERLGYIERLPDPDDLRSRRISMTRRGDAVAAVIREAVAEVEAEWTEQLGAKRFNALRALLAELNGLE